MAYQPKSRKFLAGTISAAVVASAIAPVAAFAAESKFSDVAGLDAETQAAIDALVGLNVIHGYADGTFKPNQTITKGQASELIVNALPNVDPKATPSGTVFEDVSAKNYYAKFAEALADAHLIPAGGKFGSSTEITREAMASIIVVGLGLKANDKVVDVKDLDKAAAENRDAIKILAQNGVTVLQDGNFNPTEPVKRSQFALFFYRGVAAAGIVKPAEIKAEAKAVDTNKVQVTFNSAIDTTKATVALKKGLATQFTTVSWSEDKKTATLTAPVAIPAGDYDVVLSGLEKEVKAAVKVEAAVSKTVEVINSNFVQKDGALVTFKVSNQYNTDMKIAGKDATVTAYNVTQKADVTVAAKADAKSEFTLNLATAKVDDEIRVMVTYNGITVVKSAKVVAPGTVSDITLGTVAPKTDTTRITVGDDKLVLPYTLKDQYGADVKLPAGAVNTPLSAVTFISSDNAVVETTSLAVDANGVLTFTAKGAGTATITAFINSTGKFATTTVTVNAAADLKTVAINAPTALISAGQKVTLDLAAVDQYGGAVTNLTGVKPSSSNANVGASIVNGKLVVETGLNDSTVAGTSTITLKNTAGTVTYGTVTINFEAAAVPTTLVSADTAKGLEVGATSVVKFSELKVKDQYGRDYALKATDVVNVTTVDTSDDVATVAAVAGASKFSVTTHKAGTEAVKFALTNGSSVTVTFNVVAASAITTYTVDSIGTLYAQATAKPEYNVDLTLTGKLADGTTVVLATNKVTHVTSSNEAVVGVVNTSGTIKGLTKGTSVVTLWNGTVKLADVTVTVDNATPVATTVAFAKSAYTITGTQTIDFATTTELTVTDQYGVDFDKNGFFASSDTDIATVIDGVVAKGTKTGNVTITYVTKNGIFKTTTVTVQ